jgi:hypothetical protein
LAADRIGPRDHAERRVVVARELEHGHRSAAALAAHGGIELVDAGAVRRDPRLRDRVAARLARARHHGEHRGSSEVEVHRRVAAEHGDEVLDGAVRRLADPRNVAELVDGVERRVLRGIAEGERRVVAVLEPALALAVGVAVDDARDELGALSGWHGRGRQQRVEHRNPRR